MKVTQLSKQAPYRKNSYRENSKGSFYNVREEQKPSYNYIQETKIRIVQDNLISVSGLSPQFDDPNLLADEQHFGKYGIVDKIIISTQGKNRQAFIQVYITYENPDDAAFAIRAMDGIKIEGRQISATYGTTKYCTYFLKQNQCRNDKCFYLHAYDTKNELMDGVKNNLDFLYQKSQKTISGNLKYYVQRQIKQRQNKQQSEFPTIGQTIQYLIQQGILKEQLVKKMRKQIEQQKSLKPQQRKKLKVQQKKKFQDKDKKQIQDNKKQLKQMNMTPKKQKQSDISQCSNRSVNESSKKQSDTEQNLIQLTNIVKELQMKNRKCNSLSTASSPTKYEKIDNIDQQSLDKTIERRIIKQIMRNNIIFRSKMDFVTTANSCAKQQNNKIKNYVRKHLLNQI